ncbi:MAG TPA: hypothetical protein PKW33_11895 [Anaerolineaceae bacterium]|nr:hypothetical protein [Anaerolineaceae bacterium]HPN52282.1 hypothetical protein [Anaerolineaceae bacterium]
MQAALEKYDNHDSHHPARSRVAPKTGVNGPMASNIGRKYQPVPDQGKLTEINVISSACHRHRSRVAPRSWVMWVRCAKHRPDLLLSPAITVQTARIKWALYKSRVRSRVAPKTGVNGPNSRNIGKNRHPVPSHRRFTGMWAVFCVDSKNRSRVAPKSEPNEKAQPKRRTINLTCRPVSPDKSLSCCRHLSSSFLNRTLQKKYSIIRSVGEWASRLPLQLSRKSNKVFSIIRSDYSENVLVLTDATWKNFTSGWTKNPGLTGKKPVNSINAASVALPRRSRVAPKTCVGLLWLNKIKHSCWFGFPCISSSSVFFLTDYLSRLSNPTLWGMEFIYGLLLNQDKALLTARNQYPFKFSPLIQASLNLESFWQSPGHFYKSSLVDREKNNGSCIFTEKKELPHASIFSINHLLLNTAKSEKLESIPIDPDKESDPSSREAVVKTRYTRTSIASKKLYFGVLQKRQEFGFAKIRSSQKPQKCLKMCRSRSAPITLPLRSLYAPFDDPAVAPQGFIRRFFYMVLVFICPGGNRRSARLLVPFESRNLLRKSGKYSTSITPIRTFTHPSFFQIHGRLSSRLVDLESSTLAFPVITLPESRNAIFSNPPYLFLLIQIAAQRKIKPRKNF